MCIVSLGWTTFVSLLANVVYSQIAFFCILHKMVHHIQNLISWCYDQLLVLIFEWRSYDLLFFFMDYGFWEERVRGQKLVLECYMKARWNLWDIVILFLHLFRCNHLFGVLLIIIVVIFLQLTNTHE